MTSTERAVEAAAEKIDRRKVDGSDDYYAQVEGIAADAIDAAIASGHLIPRDRLQRAFRGVQQAVLDEVWTFLDDPPPEKEQKDG